MLFLNTTTRKLRLKFILIFFSLIFFCCNKNSIPTNPNPPNPDGKTIIDRNPVWSFNGKEIAYSGGDEVIGFGIYIVDTNGNSRKKILDHYIEDITWSPDGQWIAYDDGGNIFKKKVYGDSIVQLTSSASNFSPSWSKDGKWIAYESNESSPNGFIFVWKMTPDGFDKRRILYDPSQGEIRRPSWFPDGIRLAVIRYPTGSYSANIGIIDTLGNTIAFLVNDSLTNRVPKVSNDGTQITYYRDKNHGEICTINIDGSNFQIITTHGITPDWSPDHEKIVYTNTTYGDGRIWLMNKNGSSKKKLFN